MLHILGGILSLLSALALLIVYAHECGRRRGFRQGRTEGWQSCVNWFIEAECGVEREREKIWREEG